jgi:hypothetical protein
MKTTTTALFLSSLACTASTTKVVVAWTPLSSGSSSSSSSRRTFIDQAVQIVPLVAVVTASPAFVFAADEDVAAAAAAAVSVISEPEAVVAAEPEPEVATPVTPKYDSDDFIGRLKAQSEANADKYKKDSQRSDKLSKSQFLDQYKRPSYIGVRTSKNSKDASQSTMVLQSELDLLLKDGKVAKSYESKANKKSGEISDDYSKPIYVFVN